MTFIPNQPNFVSISKQELLNLREKTIGELFAEKISADEWRLMLYYHGIIASCIVSEEDKNKIKWLNTPMWLSDVRFTSHDFSSGLWDGDSTYIISPPEGFRIIISDIFIRFCMNAYITQTNKYVLRVWKRFEGQPALVNEVIFSKVKDIINQANSIKQLPSCFGNLIEIYFSYSGGASIFDGSPICLKTGDFIEAFLEDHTPLRDISGGILPDACTISFIGKQSLDF